MAEAFAAVVDVGKAIAAALSGRYAAHVRDSLFFGRVSCRVRAPNAARHFLCRLTSSPEA
jgi:hypothetical protein